MQVPRGYLRSPVLRFPARLSGCQIIVIRIRCRVSGSIGVGLSHRQNIGLVAFSSRRSIHLGLILAILTAHRVSWGCRRSRRTGKGLWLVIELGILLKVLLKLIIILKAFVDILNKTKRSALLILSKATHGPKLKQSKDTGD